MKVLILLLLALCIFQCLTYDQNKQAELQCSGGCTWSASHWANNLPWTILQNNTLCGSTVTYGDCVTTYCDAHSASVIKEYIAAKLNHNDGACYTGGVSVDVSQMDSTASTCTSISDFAHLYTVTHPFTYAVLHGYNMGSSGPGSCSTPIGPNGQQRRR